MRLFASNQGIFEENSSTLLICLKPNLLRLNSKSDLSRTCPARKLICKTYAKVRDSDAVCSVEYEQLRGQAPRVRLAHL